VGKHSKRIPKKEVIGVRKISTPSNSSKQLTMKIKTYIVDSFTDEPFKGNPAGVCLLDDPLPDNLMQAIAMEINAAETAFLVKHAKKENTYHIRYFSPAVEVPFCGHASFASAKILLQLNNSKVVNFITGRGLELAAWPVDELIKIHFPLFQLQQYHVSPLLLKAVGIEKYGAIGFAAELDMLLIELTDKQLLLDLSPDFAAMIKAGSKIKEVVVTTPSTDSHYDFYSRCFCPWLGINEDPATGAAHSVLAAFWQKKTGKNKFKAYQCSKRGGWLNLEVLDDNLLEVVSDARIILEGSITL
jgi:predicted PhzF superfamily epimerase YddE/YHI9